MRRFFLYGIFFKVLDFFVSLMYNIYSLSDACVAQLVVQLIRNEQVAGSSPVTSSNYIMQNRHFLC